MYIHYPYNKVEYLPIISLDILIYIIRVLRLILYWSFLLIKDIIIWSAQQMNSI